MTNDNEKLVERLARAVYKWMGVEREPDEASFLYCRTEILPIIDEALAAMREECIKHRIKHHAIYLCCYGCDWTTEDEGDWEGRWAEHIRSLRPDIDATLGRIEARGALKELSALCTCPKQQWTVSDPNDSTCELPEEAHERMDALRQKVGR